MPIHQRRNICTIKKATLICLIASDLSAPLGRPLEYHQIESKRIRRSRKNTPFTSHSDITCTNHHHLLPPITKSTDLIRWHQHQHKRTRTRPHSSLGAIPETKPEKCALLSTTTTQRDVSPVALGMSARCQESTCRYPGEINNARTKSGCLHTPHPLVRFSSAPVQTTHPSIYPTKTSLPTDCSTF